MTLKKINRGQWGRNFIPPLACKFWLSFLIIIIITGSKKPHSVVDKIPPSLVPTAYSVFLKSQFISIWKIVQALRLDVEGDLEKIPISQGLVTLLHICIVKPTLQSPKSLETPHQLSILPWQAPIFTTSPYHHTELQKIPHRAPVSPHWALISSHRTASVSWCFKSVSRCLTMFYDV